MKTVAESMRTAENKKRTLEDQVDSLNEELAAAKAKGKHRACAPASKPRDEPLCWRSCYHCMSMIMSTYRSSTRVCHSACCVVLSRAATEQLYMSKLDDSEKEKSVKQATAHEMKAAMESQMEQVRDAHQKQLHALRAEISDKEEQLSQLTE